MYFAKRIREERAAAGLTQTQLAERSGIAQPNIARLEAGGVSPTEGTLVKIAKAMQIELHNLVCDKSLGARGLLRRAAREGIGEYLMAEYGDRFGVYPDGRHLVGADVGEEIAPDERPIVNVSCPGRGNVSDEIVAHLEADDDIDLDDEVNDLIEQLEAALDEAEEDYHKHMAHTCPVCGRPRD